MKYLLRRWLRRLLRLSAPQAQGASPVVTAFLDGASARECAYNYWFRGASAELATAPDWPSAVTQVEHCVRAYVDQLLEELEAQGETR